MPSRQPLLICRATVVNEGERFQASVLVEAGRIAAIYREPDAIAESVWHQSEHLEAEGCYLLPGVIDTHVHFREPGLTHKADIASESRAAVAGGVTSFFEMPNTLPQTTTRALWQDKMDRAAATSLANYSCYIGATNDNLDEILAADYRQVCGIKLFMGSSTGNMLVSDERVLSQLFESAPSVVAVHCESEARIRHNRERLVSLHGEHLPLSMHTALRDAQACYESSALAVSLAKKYHTRLHLLHVSTARELSLLSDLPLSQKHITAETCPHYLWFCQDDYDRLGAAVKCNPALKTAADRDALRQALRQGYIDVVATDHAPHAWREKQGGCLQAASGSPSVQFALPLLLELVHASQLSLEEVVNKLSHAPAQLFGVQQRGFIREGYAADLVLVSPDTWTLRAEDILSKCAWSPYLGQTFHYRVRQTFVNGQLVFDKGQLSEVAAGEALCFNKR